MLDAYAQYVQTQVKIYRGRLERQQSAGRSADGTGNETPPPAADQTLTPEQKALLEAQSKALAAVTGMNVDLATLLSASMKEASSKDHAGAPATAGAAKPKTLGTSNTIH